MPERILVFGGTGFIGEYVVKELSRKGSEVDVIDSATNDADVNRFVEKADVIIWLVPPASSLFAKVTSRLNKAAKLRLFIFVSTLLLYADSGEPHDEKDSVKPLTKYEHEKNSEERRLTEVISRLPAKLCIVRLSNAYGDIRNTGIVGKILKAFQTGETLRIDGDGTVCRDYIHVRDVSRLISGLAFVATVERVAVFNVSTGRGYSVKDVVHKVSLLVGREIEANYGPIQDNVKKCVIGNNAKILSTLGLDIEYGLDEGLRITYERFFPSEKQIG